MAEPRVDIVDIEYEAPRPFWSYVKEGMGVGAGVLLVYGLVLLAGALLFGRELAPPPAPGSGSTPKSCSNGGY